MIKYIWILFIFLYSCESDRDQEFAADFSYEFEGDCKSDEFKVAFVNESVNANSYYWDFGDGTHSTEKEPLKIYQKAGKYSVSLTSRDLKSQQTVTKEIKVLRNSDGEGPSGEFTIELVDNKSLRYRIKAVEASADYRWDFGDGSYEDSELQTIDHTFPGSGVYRIALVCTTEDGANCSEQVLKIQF